MIGRFSYLASTSGMIEFAGADPLPAMTIWRCSKDRATAVDVRTHYTVTPYSCRPQIAKKLVGNHYMDMGQGLIDCLEELHAKLQIPASGNSR